MKLFALTDLAPLTALNFWSGEGVTGVTSASLLRCRVTLTFSHWSRQTNEMQDPLAIQPVGACAETQWKDVVSVWAFETEKPKVTVAPVPPSAFHCRRAKMAAHGGDSVSFCGPLDLWEQLNRHWIKKILCLWGQPASRAKTELQMESVAFVTRCLLTVWRNPHCKLQIFSKEILLLPSCTSYLHCYFFLLLYAHMVELWSVWGEMYGSINCQCRCSFWVACLLKFNYQFHRLYILSLHLFAHSERV